MRRCPSPPTIKHRSVSVIAYPPEHCPAQDQCRYDRNGDFIYIILLMIIMDRPKTSRIAPVSYPTTLPLTLLANCALTREKKVATTMAIMRNLQHSSTMVGSMRIWLTDAINAVKVIINVEVPTAVLRS